MQNKEAEKIHNTKVNYCLFLLKKQADETYKYLQFTETSVKNTYTILWYDAKMQNYNNLNDFLVKRKLSLAKVTPYLVVDKAEYAEKSSEIFTKLRKQHKILLKRELSQQEQLMTSFSEDRNLDEESTELDLQKNFFYVINPDQRIIDTASIYSFLHEDNIHQRIVAKVLRDVDERNTKKEAWLLY